MDAPKKLSVEDFTGNDRVKACVERLQAKFPKGTSKELLVSDVIDDEGNQYVNLVQKGGGVLGVALVGYTYVLEQLGVRFLRQAGTSAGAINTALMTVIDRKQDKKSEKILDAICGLNFFSLVDGHPAARWIIKNFVKNNNFVTRVKKIIVGLFAILAVLIVSDTLLLGLEHKNNSLSFITGLSFVLTGIILLIIGAGASYAASLMRRLKNSGFGINPGNFFYDWIKAQLNKYGVDTVSQLNAKAAAPIPGMKLRVQHDEGLNDLTGDVTFITSELVTENKIQFPAMCNLFRKANDIDSLAPAGFIRASMSIPVFFESYMITDIPCTEKEIIDAWAALGVKNAPSTVRFVDGGILSNFPISLFYNPNVVSPRLPVFGIDLDDSTPEDSSNNSAAWSFGGYAGRLFNTVRNYYDKDFLMKNKIYQGGIGSIPVAEFNWLNFFMEDEQKKTLFIKGAEAAEKFLNGFNWYDYKGTRILAELEK